MSSAAPFGYDALVAHRSLLSVLAVALAVVAGCGVDEPEPPGRPTPERVQECLSEREDFYNVESIAAGRPDISSLTVEQQRVLEKVLRPSQSALGASSGGPYEEDGAISDAAVRATELHFFSGVAEAQEAARGVEPVIGSPDESVLNGVRSLGSVLVLHYSFGMGDRPGGVGIESDLEPVETCLRDAGYM